MKRCTALFICVVLISACAPVVRKDLMQTGIRDFRLADLLKNPESDKGRLFILGGVIASTRITDEGSMVEALFSPVDSTGYLRGVSASTRRFLALYPRERGILDPLIYSKNREVTIAGVFAGARAGKLDQMEYIYPLFIIEDIYLWEERRYISPVYPHPYPYWNPFPPWRYHPYYPYWW